MRTFTDALGRIYELEINGLTIARLRLAFGVDLSAERLTRGRLLQFCSRLREDGGVFRMLKVLFQPQERGLNDDDFLVGFGGGDGLIFRVLGAFLGELVQRVGSLAARRELGDLVKEQFPPMADK
jgi:hypothetical protein